MTTVTPDYLPFPFFSDFPLEIQRHIFELAFHITLTSALSYPWDWSYISHNVREWVEPLIYESFAVDSAWFYRSTWILRGYEKTFRSRPKEFYTKYVRSIHVGSCNGSMGNHSFEIELLSVCDNLTTFECWCEPREELPVLLRTKSFPKLRVLAINIDLFPKDGSTFHLPIFQHVTHLEIYSDEPTQMPSWIALQSLGNLTHMSVDIMVNILYENARMAIAQVYAIAVSARKYFPRNLKYFVIIVRSGLLYSMVNFDGDTAMDEEAWENMESIRLGTFDPRIVMGNSDDLSESELPAGIDPTQAYNNFNDYLDLVAMLPYPGTIRNDQERVDYWEVVEQVDARRRL